MQAAGGCRSIQAPHVRPRCLKSCRSEPGCVKGVSCSLLARLRVELHHLGGRPCQLAHPSGMFKEAYRNLTRNLLSSVNLLVSPRAPSHIHPDSAVLPALLPVGTACGSPKCSCFGHVPLQPVAFCSPTCFSVSVCLYFYISSNNELFLR